MASELEPLVRQLFRNFDSLDFGTIRTTMATGAQGVDEISRQWLRDPDLIADYFRKLKPMLSDVRSSLSDIRESVWGDAGLVTLWLDQSYVLNGTPHQIAAPTSVLFRKEGGDWKIALIHSVALPEDG